MTCGGFAALHAAAGANTAPAKNLWPCQRRPPLRVHPLHVPDQTTAFEGPDRDGRRVELPAVDAVDSGGREGVMVVVPGLAKGGKGEQGEVARLVGGLVRAPAEDVAERVDAVGEVMQHEDADHAAPEQPGQSGDERAADRVAEQEGNEE